MNIFSRIVELFKGESKPGVIVRKQAQEMVSDVFEFEIYDVNRGELKECKAGDFVKFWTPESGAPDVYVYRRGTVGGVGKLGMVPIEYADLISKHLDRAFGFETELLDVETGTVKCRLVTGEETKFRLLEECQSRADKIASELGRKYTRTPKDNFEIYFHLPLDHEQMEGNLLYLEERPLDHYINQKSFSLDVNLVNSSGIVVATHSNNRSLGVRMLRAKYSGYGVTVEIVEIERPDEFSLKYKENIKAKAVVRYS